MAPSKRYKLIWRGDEDKGDLSTEIFDDLYTALVRSEKLGEAGVEVVVLDIVQGIKGKPPYPFCYDFKGCLGKTGCTKDRACND